MAAINRDPYRDRLVFLEDRIGVLEAKVAALEESRSGPKKTWRKKRRLRCDLVYCGEERCDRCEHWDWLQRCYGSELAERGSPIEWDIAAVYAKCLLHQSRWMKKMQACDQFYPANRFWRKDEER